MNGEPLEISLGMLTRAAIEQAESQRRCAIYIVEGQGLRHVVGMPDAYAQCVDGFAASPESLACGLAVSQGKPVLTPDVLEEPRWQPWLWLARDYDYRGCWSFPVETASGKLVGSLAMYFQEPHEPTPRDRELVAALTQAAASIISRHQETEGRARINQQLLQSQRDLASELAATRQLQGISTELASGHDAQELYNKILDAAMSIMRADFASMQMLFERRGREHLRLLGYRGFSADAAKFWELVTSDSNSTCGMALRAAQRVIIADTTCAAMAGSEDQRRYLENGIRAALTTPLISRSGKMIGML